MAIKGNFSIKALIVTVLLMMLASSVVAAVGNEQTNTTNDVSAPSDDLQTPENTDVQQIDEMNEIQYLRTRTSKSFQQPDGSIGLKIGQSSMHYSDDSGNWADIDQSIRELDMGTYTYACESNGLKSYFDWNSPSLKVVGPDHDGITWTPIAMGVDGTYYAPQASNGNVEGRTITYTNTYPGVNEQYSIRADGLKHDFILKQLPVNAKDYVEYSGILGISQDTFFVIGDNAYLINTWTSGEILFFEEGKAGAYVIPGPVAYEQNNINNMIPLAHMITFDGTNYYYTIRAPVQWMGEMQFPIVIDPTYLYIYCYQYSTTSPYPNPYYPSGYVHYNSATATYTKVTTTTSLSTNVVGISGTYNYRTYAEWNISGLPKTAGTKVTTLYAYMYLTSESCGGYSGYGYYKYVYAYELSTRPSISTTTASTIYSQTGGGAGGTYMTGTYVYSTGTCSWSGSSTTYTNIVNARATRDWWALGFYFSFGYYSTAYMTFYSWYTGSTTSEPYLYLGYIIDTYPCTFRGAAVTPNPGYTSSTFRFNFTYEDDDNLGPSYCYMYVNRLGTTSFYGYYMSYATTTWTTGVVYYYNLAGSQFTIGTYKFQYYFYIYDGSTSYYYTTSGKTTTNPGMSFYFYGPTIRQPPGLSAATCTPSAGLKTDTYFINVTYSDADGDAAINKNVWLDGVKHTMTLVSGTPLTGQKYTYSVSGMTLGGGTHHHFFDFNSSDGSARAPSSGDYPRPIIFNNTKPVLMGAKVYPAYGAPTTMFAYEVTYMDTNSNNPTAGYPKIILDNITTMSMTYVSGNAFSGMLYRFTTSSLGVGTHSFRFNGTDGIDYAITDVSIHSGPTVNTQSAPTLRPWSPLGVSTPVDPKSGSIYENFTFAVTYNDNNNDPPNFVRMFLDNSMTPIAMTKMPSEDGIYYNDENYTTTISGMTLGVGTHEFYFEAYDGLSPGYVYSPLGPPAYKSGLRYTVKIYDTTIITNISNVLNMSNPQVAPITGSIGETFTYKFTYQSDTKPLKYGTDLEENPKVIVDGTLTYELLPSNPADIIYMDGKDYYITISGSTIKNTGVAQHYYYFTASNGVAMNKTKIHYGPNFAPILSEGGVTPDSGQESQAFTFSIVYQDPEGLPPVNQSLYIDSQWFNMTLSSSSTYTTGATYTYTLADATGLIPSIGLHSFHFEFTDSKPNPEITVAGKTKLPASGAYQFTVIKGELPDLKVSAADITMKDLGSKNIQFLANIHNIGFGAVPATKIAKVELYWNHPSSAILLKTQNVPATSLFAGNTASVDFGTVDFASVGTHGGIGSFDIYVAIEWGVSSISEVTLENNIAFVNLRLGPDLAISSGDISPNTVMSDETDLWLTVTIRNIGVEDMNFKSGAPIDLTVKIGTTTVTISDLAYYDANNILPHSISKLTAGSAVTIRVYIGDVSILFGSTKKVDVKIELNTAANPWEIIDYQSEASGKGTNNRVYSSLLIITPQHISPSFAPPLAVLCMSLALLGMIPVLQRIKVRKED